MESRPSVSNGHIASDTPPLVAVIGFFVYVADGDRGLAVFPSQCELPTATTVMGLKAISRRNEIVASWMSSSEYPELAARFRCRDPW